VVQGGEDYDVYVELDREGNVTDSECDCPYDYGPICKHQVAVFLTLRDRVSEQDATSEPSLKELLEAESKEALVSLLLSIASEGGSAAERIRLSLSKAGGQDELDDCRALIRSYIDRHSDQHGFASWRSVDHAVDGALLVAEKALAAFEAEEWMRGLELYLCVVEEMVELLQTADDSGGGVGGVIEGSLEAIATMVRELPQVPNEERMKLFRRLLTESQRPAFEGWADWQLSLLESALMLVESEEMQLAWDEVVNAISADASRSERSRGYIDERVAVLRYSCLLEHSGEAEANAFLAGQLHVPKLRELAIQAALTRGDAEEAIQLAEEGEAADRAKGLPGLVHRWKKYRFEAYRIASRIVQLRTLGAELIAEGEYDDYRTVKGTFAEGDAGWPLFLQELLDRIERVSRAQDAYTRILIEERMFERLLAYVRKAPPRIETYYGALLPHFPGEVKELFLAYIEFRAEQSNNRKDYADVSRIIRLLQRVGGKEEAYAISKQLSAKYPRRPAMREELEKIVH
jgi:hypothetical protein